MFNDLDSSQDIKEQGDYIPGGKIESGIYECAISVAYGDVSPKGSKSVTLRLRTANKQNINKTIYITNRQGQNFYIDKKTEEKTYLPGFQFIDQLCRLTVGKTLKDVQTEKKEVKIYNYEVKKELPEVKDVLTELTGKKITIGIIKEIVNKQALNADNKYVPINETREDLNFSRVFEYGSNLTWIEKKAGNTKAEFITKWDAAYSGKTSDKSKKINDGSMSNQTPNQQDSGVISDDDIPF